MTLTRGIRALSTGYYRDFLDVPDTDENLSTYIMMESKQDNCEVSVANAWPDSIMLNASMTSVEISSDIYMERRENAKLIAETKIYNNPKIDSQSNISNPASCCSKVVVNFENIGGYVLGKDVQNFVGKDFGDYRINLRSNCLFEKEFLVSSHSISEIVDQEGAVLHEHTFAKCKIYPYGGFFEYGMHPQLVESCIFRAVHDGNSLSLRISPLSALRSLGIDPCEDQREESGYQFVGVKNFSEPQKITLYDELKNGACAIEITNRNTKEKSIYRSNAILHVPKTNLITINFIGEEL
ncbi:MAG: hypothetical protein LBQ08_03325 [Holosporaceae bacterium]|jgi:hypothetical protein|nr:hypothetical protein [Holosporaceae bacterium]